MSEQTLMHQEAEEASIAVRRMLERNESVVSRWTGSLRQAPPPAVLTGARGSSDHAATFAKYALETLTGTLTVSAPPSVSSVYASQLRIRGALFLAISQSGRSPDLLAQAESARRSGAQVLAMVNDEASPLAALADQVIPLHAGPERSVAATKSYVCALASVLQVCAHWSQDRELLSALELLPEQLAAAFELDWSALPASLAAASNLFVIGRGPGLAVAQEAALKLKETCALHGEAFSAAEVRHGPMTLVDAGFPVLAFVQDDASREGTLGAAREFAARGARVLCADPDGPGALPVLAGAHPYCAPLLQIVSFYRAANALAIARGRNPDAPPHLNKVTETV
jgi:glutamine---fructose-6-phosphate transaminase (isomerizing)